MEKKTFISILVILMITFSWSCEKDSTTLTDDNLAIRSNKPENKKGGNEPSGGDVTYYKLTLHGDITSSGENFGVSSSSSIVESVLCSESWGYSEMPVSGLADFNLLDDNGNNCYEGNICGKWNIRQGNKLRPLDRAWFFLFVGSSHFYMWGDIVNGVPFLPTDGTDVTINFDEYQFKHGAGKKSSTGCSTDGIQDFPAPLVNSATIHLITDPDVIANVCDANPCG